jgi:hypothetical protein
MNTREVSVLLICLGFVVNMGDWLIVRRGRFLLAPRSGWLRYAYVTSSMFLTVLGLLFCMSIISIDSLAVAGAAYAVCWQTGAMFARHAAWRVWS